MKQKTVILGMSGGVDSSVAASILQKEGYKVIGMFMNCGIDKQRWPTTISWEDEEKEVKEVCSRLGIELIVKDTGQGYEQKVISKMFKDYGIGLTPNPDILCNNVGKFPLLYKIMKERKADFIATGHYVRIKRKGQEIQLLTGIDKNKDQSYFLVGLPKKILQKCLFPIGELNKEEVREIARKMGLSNWNKRSSRGICYLGKIDMKEFLRSRIKEKNGLLIDEKNNEIGTHQGVEFFTIGESVTATKGILLNKNGRSKYSSVKLYVAKKKKGNVLMVVTRESKELFTKKVIVIKLKLIDKNEKVLNKKFKVRIRHLGLFYNGILKKEKGKFVFEFNPNVKNVAGGQYIVLYLNGRVVGGGEMRLMN
jgi:tRNA-specific 2-thiouridylase